MSPPAAISGARGRTVVILEGHDLVRFGLESVVLGTPGLHLAGATATLAAGCRLIHRVAPDLVITDLVLRDSAGLDTVRAVVARQRPRRTLVVSACDELLYGGQVLAMGAAGYVPVATAHADAAAAALAVLDGQCWISERLSTWLLGRPPGRRSHHAGEMPRANLTPRELDVLEQLRTGKTTQQIATVLGLSPRTVEHHRTRVRRKLGLRSGAELIAYASRHP